MSELKWTINDDHFEAVTEFGTYTVGDWGGGKAHVKFAGGGTTIVPFKEGKVFAQAHYDAKLAQKEAA